MSSKFAVALLVLIQVSAFVQKPRSESPKSGITGNRQTSISNDALSTLDSILNELSEIDDLRLRIDLTETVVRLLRTSRPQRCRRALDLLFAKAMDSIDDQSKPKQSTENFDSVRRVIEIAVVLDSSLAQSYIKTFTEQQKFKTAQIPGSDTRLLLVYVKIAIQLIESDPALALLTASRSLSIGLVPDTLVFLAKLRQRAVGLANRFFLSALQTCQARNRQDVNDLLLLYAYVFTPLKIPLVTAHGMGFVNLPEYASVAESYPIDTLLAKQYLEISAKLLLDSNRYLPQNLERLANGLVGDFYFLSIIEPRIVEYLPHYAQAISQQRNIVANYLQAGDRASAFAAVDRWAAIPPTVSLTGRGDKSTVEYLVSRAEQTSNQRLKDQFHFRAALVAISDKQDKRAFDLVDKLSPEYDGVARQLLTLDLAVRKVSDGELAEAEQLARRDEVLVRRCYVFTLIADSLLKAKVKDSYNAVRLLDEIQLLAGKLSSQKEKLSVLEGAAAVYCRLDLAKALDLFRESIQTANKLDKFNGDLSIVQSLDVGGFLFDFSIYNREFGFFDLLSRLGARDFYLALEAAREIRNRSLRIHSIIVVCKAALSDLTVLIPSARTPASRAEVVRPLGHRHQSTS